MVPVPENMEPREGREAVAWPAAPGRPQAGPGQALHVPTGDLGTPWTVAWLRKVTRRTMSLFSKVNPEGTLMGRWKFQRNGVYLFSTEQKHPRRKEPRWPAGVAGALPPGSRQAHESLPRHLAGL